MKEKKIKESEALGIEKDEQIKKLIMVCEEQKKII